LLTEKQRQFVAEYLVDLNGAAAAVRAGYAVRCARSEAKRQLTNVHIRSEIDKALEARGERVQITADRVLAELAKIAFTDASDVADWSPDRGVTVRPSDSLTDSASAAISEVSENRKISPDGSVSNIHLKVKLHDKLKALEMLARHLGMMRDKDNEDPFKSMSTEDLVVLIRKNLPAIEGK